MATETKKDEKASPTIQRGAESYVAKLTIKSIGCKPDMVKTLPDSEKKFPLCRIYGKVSDVRTKEDTKNAGSWFTYFAGTFEAINLQDGEIYRSGVLYLPKGISEMMEGSFKNIQAQDKNASVHFAFEVSSVKATNPIGYSYEARALVKPEKEDELAALRGEMLKLPALGEAVTSGKKQLQGKAS